MFKMFLTFKFWCVQSFGFLTWVYVRRGTVGMSFLIIVLICFWQCVGFSDYGNKNTAWKKNMFSAYLECSKYQCFESVQSVSNGPSVYSVQSGNLGEPFERFRSPPPQSHPHQTTPQKSAQIVSFSIFSPPHHEFDKIYYLWSNCKRLYVSWLCMVTMLCPSPLPPKETGAC